jgi:hypothetical protein
VGCAVVLVLLACHWPDVQFIPIRVNAPTIRKGHCDDSNPDVNRADFRVPDDKAIQAAHRAIRDNNA